jgi:hypothetical protein
MERSFLYKESAVNDRPVEERAFFLNEDVVKRGIDRTREKSKEADKAFKGIKEEIKAFYKKSDDELINNEKNLFKIIRRYIVLVGGTKVAIAAGLVSPPVGIAAGLVTWYYTRIFRLKMTRDQKRKLVEDLEVELKFVSAKIEDEENKETKHKLIKLKAEYEKNLRKLKSLPIE